MAKSELGTKRVCPTTGRKFYDLNKDPVISPYTGEIVPVAPLVRGRPDAKVAAEKEQEIETVETEAAEFISLEDADAGAHGKGKKAVVGDAVDVDDDIEVEDGDDIDDAAFIADEEESDDDVTDIIGDGIEKEEES